MNAKDIEAAASNFSGYATQSGLDHLILSLVCVFLAQYQ